MSSPSSPPPRAGDDEPSGLTPVETDTRRIIVVGTAAFGVALIGLIVLRLAGVQWAVAHPSWTWTALAGCVLGLMGWVLVGRHRRLGRTR